MLRLHPSELTLTPEDVDETFRRIALRQSSGAQQHWTMPPARQPGPSGRPNRPILRRGPQRQVRHATTINNVPMLQPQQAAMGSMDEDSNGSNQEAAELAVQANSRPILPSSTQERPNATLGFPAALPSPPIQLPLRLRSHLQVPDMQTIANEQAQGNTSLAPQNHLSRPSGLASPSSDENGSEQRTQLPSANSSADTPGLRGGGLASIAHVSQDTIHALSPLNHIQRLGSRSGRGLASLARTSDIARDTTHAQSPLDQTQLLTSPAHQVSLGDPTKSQSSPGADHPLPHSKKCTLETSHYTHCRYHENAPSSEPRRGIDRQPHTTRSRFSGDATSCSAISPSRSVLGDPSNGAVVPPTIAKPPSRHYRGSSNSHSEDDDAFSSANHLSSTLHGLDQSDQTSRRRKERGSGGTSTSAAYSWYGSLGSDTQFLDSENLQNDEWCPQLDGTRTNAYRLSPLPSLPYTRIQNDSSAPSPSSAHSRQLSSDHIAATIAVRHDLHPPLNACVEQYNGNQQAPLNLRTHANPIIPSVSDLPTDRPNRERDMASDNTARPGPYSDHGIPYQQSLPEYGTYGLGNFSRTSEYTRLEQRLSENARVSAPTHQGDGAGHGQVQMQRAVYERLQNTAYTTHSGSGGGIDMVPSHDGGPRRNPPHDVSNRGHNHMAPGDEGLDSSSSVGTREPRHAPQGQTVPADSSRPLPSQFSRQHSTEFARQTSPRVYEGGSGGRRVQPRREGPLSAHGPFEHGSDARSRYRQSPFIRGAPTAMARTYRRVRGEQRDQENEGDEALMRREEANVVARYGEEEQQRTTMNETPPRIGRIERRMME